MKFFKLSNICKLGILISSIIFSCILVGCSLLSNNSDELHDGYYRTLFMQPNGKFIVKDEVKEEDLSQAGLVYKVEMNEDKKLSQIIALFNNKPINTEWNDSSYAYYGSFAAITVEYQDGYIKYNFKDEKMQPTNGYYQFHSIRYKLDDKDKTNLKPVIAYGYDKDGNQKNDSLGFTQMIFTYNDKGLLTKVGYGNSNGERVINKWKEYETWFDYDKDIDKNPLPITVSNHGKDGNLMIDATGTAKRTYKFDDKNRIIEICHYNVDDNLKVRNTNSIDVFNITRLSYVWIGAGAITKYTYEQNSILPSEISFYGTDGQPLGISNLDNAASIKLGYSNNTSGYLNSQTTFGTDGIPLEVNNVATMKIERDEAGNVSKLEVYNKDNNLSITPIFKAAICEVKYNDNRQRIETSFFGTSGEPILVKEDNHEYHKETFEYDTDGNLIKTTYYDIEDQEINPSIINKNTILGIWQREDGYILNVDNANWGKASYEISSFNMTADGAEMKITLNGGRTVYQVTFSNNNPNEFSMKNLTTNVVEYYNRK